MSDKQTPVGSPADPTVDFEVIEINGQRYYLCYSFLALARVEKMIGRNLLSAFGQLMISVSEYRENTPWELTMNDLLGLLWGALLTAQPDITVEQAAALLRPDNFGEIHQAIGRAYEKSMPKKETPNPPVAVAAVGEN